MRKKKSAEIDNSYEDSIERAAKSGMSREVTTSLAGP